MIDQRSKSRTLKPKRKTSEDNPKLHHIIKCGPSSSKTDMKVQNYRQTSAKDYDQQLKMKLMGLTPRNRAKETSEGVQEFIKHVSDIIEKKNPFKDTAVCSWPKGNIRPPVIDSIQFNGVSRKDQERKGQEDTENCGIDLNEVNKKLRRRLKYREIKLNSYPSLKQDSDSVRGKMKKPKSASKKKEQREDKCEKEIVPRALKKESKLVKNVTAGETDVTVSEKPPLICEEFVACLQKQNKRTRPSEIPLRKARKELDARKPKPLSLSLGKPLKGFEVQRTPCTDLYPVKPLPSMEPVTCCPELCMTINVDLSSEKISIIGEEIIPPGQYHEEETNNDIKLNDNIVDVSSVNLLEQTSSATGKKTKVTDLEKVKTSSFTVLKSSPTVLNRLEYLHKKNVLSKEKSATVKGSLQTLGSKLSFSSLKRKSSKKILQSRLTSKGNKPGLKMKEKKLKAEPKEEDNSVKILKSKVESPRLDCREIKAYRKVASPVLGNRKMERAATEDLKTKKPKKDKSQPQRLTREGTILRKSGGPSDKNEAETASKSLAEDMGFESQKVESAKSVRKSLLSKAVSEQVLISSNAQKVAIRTLHAEEEIPLTPPPTPDKSNQFYLSQIGGDEDEWSTKTITLDEKCMIEDCRYITIEPRIVEMMPEKSEAKLKESEKSKHQPLIVKGASLNSGKDEPPEKPQVPELPTVKKQLSIDLRTHEVANEEVEVEPETDVEDEEKSEEVTAHVRSSLDDKNGGNEEGNNQSRNEHPHLLPAVSLNEPGTFSMTLISSCSYLKSISLPKSDGRAKGPRKKKIRSDVGSRPSLDSSIFTNSGMVLHNKTKPDAKVRSGLTKSSKREEKSDIFEDVGAIVLKRRNSEPISFRGYVWKCADTATPKDHKASVSSLTSSMRHLNTDEIDDFVLWEAVPQRMTSCWEMSLYHFKRPWSVLSCSVFRDNRKSSTPGLILENLKNGGTLNSRRQSVNQNERVVYRNENPFDVEPSIAQKNIDIRNWLAALNFPTPPSTSNDVLSEGTFSSQLSDGQNLNKPQVSQKRRKIVPNLKFSDESSKKKLDDKKYRKSSKWCNEEGLTDLVRRKSGGFVTSEQFFNSEQFVHRQNVTLNLCVSSKSAEESVLVETYDRNNICEPRKYKSVEIRTQPELSISSTIINSGAVVGDQLIEQVKSKENEEQEETPVQGRGHNLGKILKGEVALISPDINIWKYLFLMTVFVIALRYCYVNNYMCYN